MKTLLAGVAILFLAGCQATFWAQAPLPGGSCDPTAAGRWLSQSTNEDGSSEGMRLIVDAGCQLVAEKLANDEVIERSKPAMVRMASSHGQSFAWLDANTLLAYEGVAHRTRDTDVMVFRYRINGDQLQVWNINHMFVRSQIEEGAIPGVFEDTGEDEFNRITGAVAPDLFADTALFDVPPITLEREGGQP